MPHSDEIPVHVFEQLSSLKDLGYVQERNDADFEIEEVQSVRDLVSTSWIIWHVIWAYQKIFRNLSIKTEWETHCRKNEVFH